MTLQPWNPGEQGSCHSSRKGSFKGSGKDSSIPTQIQGSRFQEGSSKVPVRFQGCSVFSGCAFLCHHSPAPEIEPQKSMCPAKIKQDVTENYLFRTFCRNNVHTILYFKCRAKTFYRVKTIWLEGPVACSDTRVVAEA